MRKKSEKWGFDTSEWSGARNFFWKDLLALSKTPRRTTRMMLEGFSPSKTPLRFRMGFSQRWCACDIWGKSGFVDTGLKMRPTQIELPRSDRCTQTARCGRASCIAASHSTAPTGHAARRGTRCERWCASRDWGGAWRPRIGARPPPRGAVDSRRVLASLESPRRRARRPRSRSAPPRAR